MCKHHLQVRILNTIARYNSIFSNDRLPIAELQRQMQRLPKIYTAYQIWPQPDVKVSIGNSMVAAESS